MIKWKPVKEKTIEGDTPLGKAWIKLDKEGRTISSYLTFLALDTQKFLPETEEEDPEFTKLLLEEELEKIDIKLKLIQSLKV